MNSEEVKELKEQIKELQRKLAKMEKEPKVWKPKIGERYYDINKYNCIADNEYVNDSFDKAHYEIGNCFKTKEEAKKTLEKFKIYMQLKRYAEEHNTEPIQKSNFNQDKYYITFDIYDTSLSIDHCKNSLDIGEIYFTEEQIAEEAIRKIGLSNIIKLFEED